MSEVKKVIFITGASYSGTTLLSMMLGAAQYTLFAGEVERCRFSEPKICQTCGFNCSIWKDFEYTQEARVYELLAQRSNASVIIDATKKPVSWIAEQTELLSAQNIAWTLVLLTCDPRSVVYRHWKKEPHITIEEHARAWFKETGAREKLFRNLTPSGPTLRTRYEELVTNPETVLPTICNGIDLQFEENMLYPGKAHQHRLVRKIGSKRMPEESLQFAAPLNEEWKNGLNQDDEQKIIEVAGELFPLYKYEP